MRTSIAIRWRGALENPLDYPQSRDVDYLKRYGRYSPFGILCQVYTSLTQNGGWSQGVDEGVEIFMGHSSQLPKEVIGWAAMSPQEVNKLRRADHRKVAEWIRITQGSPEDFLMPPSN